MAAISSLVMNDTHLRKDTQEDDRSMTMSRLITQPVTPHGTDNDSMKSGQEIPASTQESATQTSSAGSHVTTESRPYDHSDDQHPDSMDLDNNPDDPDISDAETEQGDDGGSRKKKGQRFFCTGYPPCNLSFTRSEHLARHIRKHTGERPFQCHCNRRFSRLDNLRQHAQTVHVNEEIPTDSLAATGTRYQRQIRTDRVRPAGRPRTSTMSSTGSHSRGHSRNLSTSSIGSIASTSSNYSVSTEPRRRPPPLLVAGDGLNRPVTPPGQYQHYAHSPGDMSTPTSAMFPATPSSPSFGSTMGSPLSMAARPVGILGDSRGHARRLSVPSSAHTSLAPPYTPSYGPPGGGPGPAVPSTPNTVTSPTNSNFSHNTNYQNPSPSEEWRRRTWHPSTYSSLNYNYNRPATSSLTYSQTPDAPQPAYASNATAAAGQAPRLPGIESFDHVQLRPSSPPKPNGSPSRNELIRPTPPSIPKLDPNTIQRAPGMWEGTKRSQYPESIVRGHRPSLSWGQSTVEQIHGIGQQRPGYQLPSMGPPLPANNGTMPHQMAQEALHLQTSNKRAKRNSWYNAPVPANRTSPEDSSSSEGLPTPGTSTVEIHPAIVHSNDYMEPQHVSLAGDGNSNPCLAPPIQVSSSYQEHRHRPRTSSMASHGANSSDTDRLDALVAVATSESNTTARTT